MIRNIKYSFIQLKNDYSTEKVKKANSENDWSSYGKFMNTLEESIAELKKSIEPGKE